MTDENESGKSLKGSMPTVEKLLNFIQDKDARLGLVLSVFLLFLITFVWFSNAYGGGFSSLIRTFGTFLLLATVVVIFFKVIDGSILPRVIVWYFTSLLLLTVSLFWVQAILSTPTPFLVKPRCFVDLWSQGCPLGISVAPDAVKAPPPDPTQPSGSAPDKPNKVYVQFAGALLRENVIKVSMKLLKEGWNVQEAERGGERTAQAVGIDQVRYFHSGDQDIAKRLATRYNELASSWPGFDQLSVAFVPGNESRVPVGQLEVWTSVD